MNKQRRESIKKAYGLIEDAKDRIDMALADEQESYDNLPEGIQCSERGEEMEENIEQLEECSGNLEDALSAIDMFV